jgi:hypothetical protein
MLAALMQHFIDNLTALPVASMSWLSEEIKHSTVILSEMTPLFQIVIFLLGGPDYGNPGRPATQG